MAQDITLMGSVFENVPSITLPKVGGGTAKFIDDETAIKNYVHGEFHTNSVTGTQAVEIPYNGTGYPIMLYVCIKGGAYVPDTAWYELIKRYAVGAWAMTKTDMSLTPTFTTSGIENQGVTMGIFKNSTTDPAVFGRTSAMTTNVFSSANSSNSVAASVKVKDDAKTLSVYVATTATYGLQPDQDYEYFIVYSS